jgi:hypothetical protein
MLKRGVLVAVVFLLVSTGVAQATPWQTEPKFELEGIWWFSNIKANIDVGSDINAKSDLGVTDSQFAEGRLTWNINDNHSIRFGIAHISNDGSKKVQSEFVFNGTTYPVGAKVDTTIDFTYSRLGWTWQFINIANNTFKFGTMLDMDWFILDPKINGTVTVDNSKSHLDASRKFNLLLPTIGLAADCNPIKYLNIFADASGIMSGKYGYMADAEIGVKVIPIKWFSIVGSYRYLELKAKDGSDTAKITYNGPYVGLTIRY